MTSRQRLQATLNHCAPDRVCVDFGSTAITGMHASAVSRLRRTVLGDDAYRVKVIEPFQMLGQIDDDLREALGIDVAGIPSRATMFGFENTGWRPFEWPAAPCCQATKLWSLSPGRPGQPGQPGCRTLTGQSPVLPS